MVEAITFNSDNLLCYNTGYWFQGVISMGHCKVAVVSTLMLLTAGAAKAQSPDRLIEIKPAETKRLDAKQLDAITA